MHSEEKKLLAVFPDTYSQYCKKVPRILPRLSILINLEICEYLPIKMSWFYREIGSISTLLLLTLLAESWEDIYQKGIKAYLKDSVWLAVTFILFVIFVILLSKLTRDKYETSANKS